MNNGNKNNGLIRKGSGATGSPNGLPFEAAALEATLGTPLDSIAGPTPGFASHASQPTLHAGSHNELGRLLQMMRGRWIAAITTAVVLGVIGAVLGFRSGHKLYASTGQIRVLAVVPKVLYQVDEKGVPPMFDSFIESQVALLQSQRVMELAIQDPAWHTLGRAQDDAAVRSLMHSIDVVHSGELITIKATDLDPAVAVTSVQTVVGAFEKLYEESDALSNEKRLMQLQSIQNAKGAELAAIREQISNIGRPYGTDDLHHLFELKESEVEKLQSTISQTQADLIAAVRRSRAGGSDQLTPEQWAVVSAEMASLLQERNTAKRNLEVLKANNVMAKSPIYATAQATLDVDQRAVDDLVEQLQAQRAAGQRLPASPGTEGKAFVEPETLRQELAELGKQLEVAKADMIAVGDQQLKISDLKYKADQAIRDRDAAQQRIDQLNTEATINGRVSIISTGDRPLAPDKDTRIPFAAAGLLGGAIVGFALIIGFAAVDHRLRSPDEAEASVPSSSLLGLLPWLPDDLADSEQAARTAHCVTGIRNLLQLWGRPRDKRVFLVTSPVAGAGKTSLTFALGISYAASKFKTLIIDCDLVGAGLTWRTDRIVTRKLGQLLREEGLLTDEQLSVALAAAKEQSKRLGEIVVEKGWTTREHVDRLLADQTQQHLGILDALDGMPLDQCVSETGIADLSILPVGTATSREVQLLSAESLQKLFDSARRAYDIVLVDTGPMPGSLEAQLASAVADGVVVVVSAGVNRSLVRRCVERLVTVGAQVAGIVYNRASEADVLVYTSGSQSRIASRAPVQLQAQRADSRKSNSEAEKLGPLASAVSRSAPVPRSSRSSK
jgi:succinoglycan biosynthesis transport protein ExoP